MACIDFRTERLTFGKKFSGAKIRVYVADYLSWMLSEVRQLTADERDFIEDELDRRINARGSEQRTNSNRFRPAANLPVSVSPEIIAHIVTAGRQQLAKRYHPDMGGDAAFMVQINATADYLISQARSLVVA